MKSILIGMLLLASILIVGCVEKQVVIGGDKDTHGCLIAAGYSWNDTIGACARSWELDADQAEAAWIAVSPMSYRPITVVAVESLRCPGCFRVDIQRGDTQVTDSIIIRDGKIDSGYPIDSFEECVEAGYPVMESYPRQCSANGQTFTEVIVTETEHLCTEQESLTTACTMEYAPVCGRLVLNTGETVYQTFGNGCSACAAMKVVGYTRGECPQDDRDNECSDGKGNYLNLAEAITVARSSECKDNLVISCDCPEGYVKDGETCNPACYHSEPSAQQCLAPSMQCERTYFCNKITGTYWFNLNITKPGCSPACVVNVENRSVEINWRCTGLLT